MKSIIKNYCKLTGILAVLMILMTASFCIVKSDAKAAEKSIEIKIPYKQTFENDSVKTDVNDEFRYSLKAVDEKSPMPEGITDAYYYTLKGNVTGELKLDIVFERPGVYSYVVSPYVEKAEKGYTYEKGKYTVSVTVINDDATGGFKQGAITIQDENLDKYGEVPSNVSYYEKAPSTPSKSTPTPKPTQRPRRRPSYVPSGGNPPPSTVDIPDDDGFPIDDGEEVPEPEEEDETPEATPTDEPTVTSVPETAKPTEKPAEPEKEEDAWALVNLILTILMIIISLVDIILFFVKKKKKEDEEEGTTEKKKRHLGLRLATLIPAIAGVILFLLTEDWTLPYTWIDKWTFWHVIILLIGIMLAAFSGAGKKKDDAPTDAEPS